VSASHGGSGKQARSIIDGLEADVATLALSGDIDVLASKAFLIPNDWQSRLKLNSSPYTSTIVLLVRKGNPKNIKDWDDLIKPGVAVVTPNPKTSGGARWNYLAAYAYALKNNKNDHAKARDFVGKLYSNVSVLDSGARGSLTTFTERGIGDVLISGENEAFLASKVAQAYLEYLYSPEGQEIAASNYYRPTDDKVAAKYASQFPKLELISIDKVFCGWRKVQPEHFADGGVFDKIYSKK
jgi:sulfate transport system substrate-binding protein